jgi:hypothetical protein
MNFTLGSHKTVKRGKEPLIAAFVPPKTRDLDPSSYFPNSFRRGILGNPHSPGCIAYHPPEHSPTNF